MSHLPPVTRGASLLVLGPQRWLSAAEAGYPRPRGVWAEPPRAPAPAVSQWSLEPPLGGGASPRPLPRDHRHGSTRSLVPPSSRCARPAWGLSAVDADPPRDHPGDPQRVSSDTHGPAAPAGRPARALSGAGPPCVRLGAGWARQHRTRQNHRDRGAHVSALSHRHRPLSPRPGLCPTHYCPVAVSLAPQVSPCRDGGPGAGDL